MLTNAHVVETCKSVTVSLGDGDTADAKIAAKDSQNDLALLVATTKIPQYARFAATAPRQGDEVVVYGFPLPGALSTQGNLTTGILSAMVGLRDDSRQFQISAPVQPGNSGGPLFDRNGAVIGVVSSKINALRVAAATGDVPQNVNFAIKANVVSNFLETNGMKFESAPKGKAMDIADISERARGFTFLITCAR
jgi:S1-C subfamily serine protease